MKYDFYKRLIDLFFSSIILIIVSPIIFFFVIVIALIDLQSPLFVQERSGKKGIKINIYKLRTIKKKINGTSYVTKLGKFLRLTKIDELPQLLNVLAGSLSLVGPRPLYLEFNKYYSLNHINRLNIKPGITGLAQIKIRDSTDWKRKFNFDNVYFKKYSFKVDIYIIIMTFKLLFSSIMNKNKRPIETIDYKKSFLEKYKR